MFALLEKATTLHSQGLLTEAEQLYRSVLADNPDQPDALALLGSLLASRKEYAQAVSFIEHAIRLDPQTPLFRFYLGNVFLDMSKTARAVETFEEALARQPHFVDAHIKLALIFEKQNELAKAIEHLQNAVQIKPDSGSVWVKLSEISFRCGDLEQAAKAAENAVRLMPGDLAAHVARALAMDSLDREEEALVSLQRALRIKPDFSQAWDMLGTTYQKLGRLIEAEEAYRKAIDVAGCVLENEDGREIDENNYSVQHWNLALLELLRGDYRSGFAHYRARFKKAGRNQRLPFPQKLWRGEDLRDKKILVVGEQGFGDVLMLCRFAPLLKAKGAHVVLLAHDALRDLLKTANIADEIIGEAPQEQGDFDYQTSIFDLPFRLKTTIETIPASVYLPSPLPDEPTTLPDARRSRIGVVWAGKKDFGNDRRRSIPFEIFSKLFDKTNVQFFNFTHELTAHDSDVLARRSIVELSSKLDDFLTTAKYVAQLDLVITCDTAMAHLAGGMGKKVWVLLPFAPDWRWLTQREDSPWYPSARLFRQKTKADWTEVVARVRNELAQLFP